jgi:hypothetical protein
MASYALNEAAVTKAPALIDAKRYVLDSDWGAVQPKADAANAFRRLHRSGLIACVYRAMEWRHKAVELAAFDLLQRLDAQAGITP